LSENCYGFLRAIFADTDYKVFRSLETSRAFQFIKAVNLISGNANASGNLMKVKNDECLINNVLTHLQDEIIRCKEETCKFFLMIKMKWKIYVSFYAFLLKGTLETEDFN